MGENNPSWEPDREKRYAPYGFNFNDPTLRNNKWKLQKGRDMFTGKKLEPFNKKNLPQYHHIYYTKSDDNPDNHCWISNKNHGKITSANPWKKNKIKKQLQENTQDLNEGKTPRHWPEKNKELFAEESKKQTEITDFNNNDIEKNKKETEGKRTNGELDTNIEKKKGKEDIEDGYDKNVRDIAEKEKEKFDGEFDIDKKKESEFEDVIDTETEEEKEENEFKDVIDTETEEEKEENEFEDVIDTEIEDGKKENEFEDVIDTEIEDGKKENEFEDVFDTKIEEEKEENEFEDVIDTETDEEKTENEFEDVIDTETEEEKTESEFEDVIDIETEEEKEKSEFNEKI